jgi:hypothetical protein
LKKKGLLIILVTIFLCACTFIQKKETNSVNDETDIALNQFDMIIKKAEEYAKLSESTDVQEVFHDQNDQIWKIHFMDGTIILYDEKTNELVHAE